MARNKLISLDSTPREFRPKWENKDNGKVCNDLYEVGKALRTLEDSPENKEDK